MNYYQRNIGDYQRDTGDLSLLEHGAYSMLLDSYYANESPLPMDPSRLYRICKATTATEKRAVESVAKRFFNTNGEVLTNKRADHEISEYQRRAGSARRNGGKGGRPRQNQEITPSAVRVCEKYLHVDSSKTHDQKITQSVISATTETQIPITQPVISSVPETTGFQAHSAISEVPDHPISITQSVILATPETTISITQPVSSSETQKEPRKKLIQNTEYRIQNTEQILSDSAKPESSAISTKSSGFSADVEAIYAAYPRRVKPKDAKSAIAKALKKIPFGALISAVTEFAASPKGAGDFCPYPATWFNAECWSDDRSEWHRPQSGGQQPGRTSLNRIGPGQRFEPPPGEQRKPLW